MFFRRRAAAFLLTLGLSAPIARSAPPAPADGGPFQSASAPAILRIRVIDGEGAIHTAGTRSNQPIVIVLTDETGRPVENASVSLRLPDEAPTGSFANGLRTDIALTGPDGRVVIRGIQWTRAAGPVQIRITASKGEARSGILSTQYVTEPAGSTPRRAADTPVRSARTPARIDSPSRSKWILVAALVGGAAAGGVAAAARGGRSAPGVPPAVIAPPATTAPSTVIGPPAIVIGRP